MKKKHSDHKNMTITNVSYNLAAQLNENSFLIQKINGFEYRYLTTILSFNIFKMISILSFLLNIWSIEKLLQEEKII